MNKTPKVGNCKGETFLNTNPVPQRGEIWRVNFDPTLGAEIKKIRPAVVISSDAVGKLPIKLIAPITDWKPYFAPKFWLVRIDPDSTNGLTKVSAVDTLQLRGMDLQRFICKLGNLPEITMAEIAAAVAAVVEYQAPQVSQSNRIAIGETERASPRGYPCKHGAPRPLPDVPSGRVSARLIYSTVVSNH